MIESSSRGSHGDGSDLSVSVKTSLLPHMPLAGWSRSNWRQAVHTDSHVNLELKGSLVYTFVAMSLKVCPAGLGPGLCHFVSQGGHHSALGQIVQLVASISNVKYGQRSKQAQDKRFRDTHLRRREKLRLQV